MTPEAMDCARVIFQFLQLGHKITTADAMIVLGTNDTRVAEFAAKLYHRNLAPVHVVTGGLAHQNDMLATNWDRSEAEVFARIMGEHGVPRERLLLECAALNTAQNISLSRKLLAKHDLAPKSILYVVKPFMQRRVYATHVVEWPEASANVVTWETTFDEYCNDELYPWKITNIMMGDLQRVWIYAKKGYSAAQKIPADVQRAFDRLVELGFTRHLLTKE